MRRNSQIELRILADWSQDAALVDRMPVESRSIRSIGYDVGTATLEIEFQNGRVYQYPDFPVDVYEEFISAPSKGIYFIEGIRNCYRQFEAEVTPN